MLGEQGEDVLPEVHEETGECKLRVFALVQHLRHTALHHLMVEIAGAQLAHAPAGEERRMRRSVHHSITYIRHPIIHTLTPSKLKITQSHTSSSNNLHTQSSLQLAHLSASATSPESTYSCTSRSTATFISFTGRPSPGPQMRSSWAPAAPERK